MKLKTGDDIPVFRVRDVFGDEIFSKQYEGRKLLVSFLQSPDCPFCDFRIHELKKKYVDYSWRGLCIIAIFESPSERLPEYAEEEDIPFPVVADPERRICRFFKREEKLLANPADFLIRQDQKIFKSYYGKDSTDHIPLNAIEEFLDSYISCPCHSFCMKSSKKRGEACHDGFRPQIQKNSLRRENSSY